MPDINQNNAALCWNSSDRAVALKAYLLAEQVGADLDECRYGLGDYARADDPTAKQAASMHLDQVNAILSADTNKLELMAGQTELLEEQPILLAKSARSQQAWINEVRKLMAAPPNGERHMYKNPQQDELLHLLTKMRKLIGARRISAWN